ncbi:MAG TPA: helix-turn-helix domain-containing GNAT family N-acetyltransferase [Dehalococcoidia bacterium]
MRSETHQTDLDERVAAVRRFNRFYTQRIGVLPEGYLGSPFSLTEARVLYELAQREETTASELAAYLGLDPGYLSRILQRFQRRGLIDRRRSEGDGRRAEVSLTEQGWQAFEPLAARSREQVGEMLSGLSPLEQERLVEAMRTIQGLLGGRPEPRVPFLLRPPRPGDLGWVVHRHGALYAREYGWNEEFEALVAGIVAQFVQEHDPNRERCWMAEREGHTVGSVFLVRKSEMVAQLRLLLVEPEARGLGIGSYLVDECVRFARAVGYRQVTLWTQSVLTAARHIYQRAGFRLVHAEPHHSFGCDLVGETWELDL